MYLRRATVRNFMVHQETTLNLQPLNILIGPNGSGKSAFFDAMLNFSMLARGNLREAFGPYPYSYRATLHHGAMRNISSIGYNFCLSRQRSSDAHLDYEIRYLQAGADEAIRYNISSERLRSGSGELIFDREHPETFEGYNRLGLEADRAVLASVRRALISGSSSPDEFDPLVVYCSQQVSRFNRFRLEPYVLAQPSALPDVSGAVTTEGESEPSVRSLVPRLGYRGENLASTLFYLSETSSSQLDGIRELLKQVEPNFSDFEFNTVGPDRVGFSFSFTDLRQTVPASRLSSGMLSYLGLIVLVSAPNRPSVLMIEEPENGLTAQATKTFFGAVSELAALDSPDGSQIFISTHSPVLFSEAWNTKGSDVIHHFRIRNGKAHVRDVSVDGLKAGGIHLSEQRGRPHMGINNAAEIMSGYLD